MSQSSLPFRIKLNDAEEVESLADKTILESLEEQGVEVNFHCRDGFCGACRCKIKRGEVDYTVDPLAFIDDDEILTCCTKPLSDIELELY